METRLLATGWHGLILSLAVIMFSFGGLALSASPPPKRKPEKSIPKAVNQVVIVSCCSISVRWWCCWRSTVGGDQRQQPVCDDFHNLDSKLVASALNFVILVASLSVYNSGVPNSRMLFGLSVQGNAPKFSPASASAACR